VIPDKEHGAIILAPYLYLDRRATVPVSIVEQVAHHALQKGSVPVHDGWFAGDGTVLVANGLLGGDAKQIDILG
jgi:hypothetical protein